ncbi:MAG: hypothetical protein ABSD21_08890 [Rhizomicrobium sp.]|jgi:trans-2-enoyl-CoA reductase
MTKTTDKRDHKPVLIAALSLLGAALGISTSAGAADTTGLFLKGHDTTTSTQIKGETTSNQYKEHAPSAMFLKKNATASHQIKGETHSNQIKLNSTGGSQTH